MAIRKITMFASITAILTASCGSDAPPPPPPPPPPTNAAPAFTSAATATVEERSTQSFYTATASDTNGDTLTFSITGGADSGLFTLTGADLAFSTAADFEVPGDANQDNVYELTLSVSDGQATTTQNLAVTVTDVTDTAMRTSRIGVGFDRPIFATGAGDGTNRLFIVQQGGLIRIIDLNNNNANLATPFLDISALVSTGNEQGLLGLAFAPDYATSGLFYVNITNFNGDTQVFEYQVDSSDPNIADVNSARLLLGINQPFANHNAGWMSFGPDGMLYIATGDGGGAGDPQGNSQNTNNLLGAILRIDPTGDDFPTDSNRNYAVPQDNPFVNSAELDEIFAYGLRNPFRNSFDPQTGDLYIGDVGQGRIEEIDLVPAGTSGQNFGWNILEGTMAFMAGPVTGLTAPIAEYPHENTPNGGFSVTGGYVHRGSVEALIDNYVFADFVTGNIWRIPVSDVVQGSTIAATDFDNITDQLTPPDFGMITSISSFGVDDTGELYILDLFRGEIFRVENDE